MNIRAKEYGTEKRQAELLKMLKDVDVYFRKWNITYSLAAGSLLGAVRENGFIPWDDDVDIMVDRDNYNKITEVFSRENSFEYILKRVLWIRRIQRCDEKNEGLSAPTIDIFVMDNSPENNFIRKIKLLLIKVLQGMMKKDISYNNVPLFYKLSIGITHLIGLPFSDETKFKWYEKVAQIGNEHDSDHLGMYYDPFEYLDRRYKSTTFDKMEYHKFEDTELPITSEYDSCLSVAYGDYMTPPPEAERVTVHSRTQK